jgi:hypothetical protein
MNITNLKSDINFLCGSTSATYLDADKIRNINIAYQDVARLIWESAAGWQYDDSNNTTLPIARTSMVHNQQDYTLPSTAQRIHGVTVLDADGHEIKLKPIDEHDSDIPLDELYSTPGLPMYYNLVGRSALLIPSPASGSVTLSAGLAFLVDRDVTEFPTTASTATPGFATAFHRILSYAAAIDFVQDEKQKQFMINQKARLEEGLTRFYAKRMVENKLTIKPSNKKRWRQWL